MTDMMSRNMADKPKRELSYEFVRLSLHWLKVLKKDGTSYNNRRAYSNG